MQPTSGETHAPILIEEFPVQDAARLDSKLRHLDWVRSPRGRYHRRRESPRIYEARRLDFALVPW